jgi:GT2 family glycosyltransferase
MNITFCINTARNERNHVELLFRSLYKNLSRRDHPIIVYVENDNQDTVGFLKTQKEHFPNLKIIINPLPVPIGYARNINMMFEMAETDVVSYLQSDMVISPLYDKEIAKFLTPDTIISATRIEPPLHPPSPEKITFDFGLDPTSFDLDRFSDYANKCKKDHLTDYWFAPFTLYRKNWVDIGGHDTLFRRSREDSDLLYRFSMSGIKIKQAWNAIVYHFTCTSSRGPEWWTEKGKARAQLQQSADVIEMQRFLRKWPAFKHTTTFDSENEYKYQISANFTNAAPRDVELVRYYWLFHRIYVDNQHAREAMRNIYGQFHNPANELLNITTEQWNIYGKYYRQWKFDDIFTSEPITTDDSIINIDLKGLPFTETLSLHGHTLQQLNTVVHLNRNEDPGEFEFSNIGTMVINRAENRIRDNIKVINPPLDVRFTIL